MSLAMDVVICGTENCTNGCHLTVFSVDVVFARQYMATPTLHYRSASGIGYASKNCPKQWATQLAIKLIAGEQINYKQLQNQSKYQVSSNLFSFLSYKTSNNGISQYL